MRSYLLRRLGQAALTLAGVSLLVFVILRVIPGDPAKMLLPEGAPQSAVDALNRELGLREPIWVQYGIFLRSVAWGDFGQSFQYRAPALQVVVERAPATIQLALAAMLLTVLVGVPLGVLAAVRRGTGYDYAGTVLAVLGQSLPNFWLGIMLILLFGVTLRWLPTSGFQGWSYLVLPSITLAAFPTALVARLTRSSLLEILGQEYVRTGRAKGLGERAVIWRHALRNAMIPLLTVLGLQIGTLLGGAVITESIFAWPGMGKLVVDAIFFRDFPVVQTVLIISATIFVVINLLIDLLYTVLDPRIRYGMSRLRRYPMVALGGLILGAMILASAGAPLLAPADPIKPSFGKRLQPPRVFGGASPYLLGTDNLGRDILARLLYGGRVSLTLATSAAVLAAAVGVAVGLAAGVLGGRVDDAIMRVADVQLAFPVIMLAIAIVAVVGTSRTALVSVLALSGWVLYARTVRASVLTIRQLDYVEAARTLGASDLRVILLHILPNTLAPILVIGSSQFATMVLLESGLSFLGLGVQPPQPSWGAMLAEGRDYLSNAWWLATVPGVAISFVVLGANLLGDGLRDLLDPRLRQ